MSSINFADVLTAFGRFIIDDRAAVVGGDRSGKASPVTRSVLWPEGGCWRTFDANLVVAARAGDHGGHCACHRSCTNDLAQIKAGDKAPIHLPPAVVGQAACLIRAKGAEIFAPPVPRGEPCCATWASSMSTILAAQRRVRHRSARHRRADIVELPTGAAQRAGLELLPSASRNRQGRRLRQQLFHRGLTFIAWTSRMSVTQRPNRAGCVQVTAGCRLHCNALITRWPRRPRHPGTSNAEHTGKLVRHAPRRP